MQNIFLPYVNLMNANIEALSRFVNAREVTGLASDTATMSTKILQESTSMVVDSNAYAELMKATIDNYVRFANEWLQNTCGIVAQGQLFVNRQVEEGQRRFSVAAELSRRSTEAAAKSGRLAGHEISRQRGR